MSDEPESILDLAGASIRSGRCDRRLAQHAGHWREKPGVYNLSNAIGQAKAEGRGSDLLATILDEEFRRLRLQWTGVEGRQADLYAAREYFREREPDLIRYLQVLFLEQRPFGTPVSRSAQEQHCRAYAEFLQLDRLPHERSKGGLDGVLRKFFPEDAPADQQRLCLIGYELGKWHCSCGQLTGFARRYDHACPCGTVRGHGRIDPTAPPCPNCHGAVEYIVCPDCRTRVTLANLWQVKRGGTRAADYWLPLTVDISLVDHGGTVNRDRIRLLSLPLPIGLHERDGEPTFVPPVVFWESSLATGPDDRAAGHRFLGLKDALGYDGRSEFGAILDALLRRTLLRTRGSYARFTQDLIHHMIELLYQSGRLLPAYTRDFWRRLGHPTVTGLHAGNLVGLGAVSFQCTVASSAQLRGTAALLGSHFTDPGKLAVPRLQQLELSLPAGAELSQSPWGVSAARTESLSECGLAEPGSEVKPGQLLVGAVVPVPEGTHLLPEERLAKAVWGEDAGRRTKCLTMPGELPGWVLDQQLTGPLATDAVPAAPGRHLDPGMLAASTHVTVTVAVDHALRPGDTLDGEAGGSVTVCGLASGATLRQIAAVSDEPDLVVAPDHPWAPPLGEPARTVQVRLAVDRLAGGDTGAWSSGNVDLISKQPPPSSGGEGAQVIKPVEFRWLVERGARHLAMELYGPRSDCADWRTELRTTLETAGHGPLAPSLEPPSALEDAVSHGVRRLDLTLRAARLVPLLHPDGIGLQLMSDSDVIIRSHGEVHQEWPFEVRDMRPRKGGLFCQDIFGQDREDECACGMHHNRRRVGRACEDCGRTLTSPTERGRRFGHLRLPATVVHSWFLDGAAGERLAMLMDVTISQLRAIADCELFVVTDPGSTTWRVGQLVDTETWFRTVDRYGASAATGGSAVKIMLYRAGKVGDLPLDTVAIRRLPVLPPDLRPFVLNDAGLPYRSHDLNQLYRAVILSGEALVRQRDKAYTTERHELESRRRLQHSVDRLLGPAADVVARVGIADSLTLLGNPVGSLRDDLLRRSVDYSARARIVVGRLPDPEEEAAVADPGTVLLGRDLVLRLLEPVMVHALATGGAAESPRQAQTLLQNPTADVFRLLDAVCERSRILVAFPHGPWRMVALGLRASKTPTLEVQPALLDLIGRQNLGESARIFAIQSDEAQREAADRLTVAALRRAGARTTPPPDRPGSFFDLPCEDLAHSLADAALTTATFPLTPDDGLILCQPDWLTDPGSSPDSADPPAGGPSH
ncbi:hypothetical protein ACXNSR_16190 [Streptomyces sp. NC-S4]